MRLEIVQKIIDKVRGKNKSGDISEEDKKSFPPVIPIDTVSLCDLRCSMCIHQKMKRKKGFMKWELFEKIINEIAAENKDTMVWMVFFGEPFVRAKYNPNIFEMIKFAKQKGLTNVVVNTNGNLMNEDNARKLIESGVNEIYIGIDAFNSKTYNENRVGGDYDLVVKNVLKLLELKEEMNKAELKINVQFIEMDNNLDQKDDFVEFWQNAGAEVKVRQMITWAGKSDRKQEQDCRSERRCCSWALTTSAILNTGDVVCAADLDGEHSFGNVNETSIKEIWNGEKMRHFRDCHENGKWDELHTLCRNCTDWQGSDTDVILE